MGVASSITPVLDHFDRRDAQQTYAPHSYDLVTDSNYVHAASSERVDFIFGQHATSQRLAMPMLIGEWGAYRWRANRSRGIIFNVNKRQPRIASTVAACFMA